MPTQQALLPALQSRKTSWRIPWTEESLTRAHLVLCSGDVRFRRIASFEPGWKEKGLRPEDRNRVPRSQDEEHSRCLE